MPNKMLIDATHPEETRVVVVRGNRVEEFDFESAQRKQLRGNIYLAKVTRVEPSLQAAFIEYGGNRHGFLAFSEIHPDYYQIPVADRQALIEADERAHREAEEESENRSSRRRSRHRNSRRRSSGERVQSEIIEGTGPETEAGAPEADTAQVGDHTPDHPHDDAHVDYEHHADAPEHEEAHEVAAVAPRGDDHQQEHHADDAEHVVAASPEQSAAEAAPPQSSDDHANDGEHNHHDDNESRDSIAAHGDEHQEERHADDADDDGEDDEDGDDAEEDVVESVGGDDVLEEVPERAFRPRRQYKIQEVIKRRQVMLVQVVKEERGNKGAALTTYLSLAGRYAVLMPNTARGGGISRKITSAQDRNRLKDVVQDLDVPEGMGIILRTAGASRTKPEIKRDFEYLIRMWETVRDTTLKSQAPTLVYEEGSLIKRSLRDLYNKEIDEVLVAGEAGYNEARDFMKMLMPTNVRAVKQYRDGQPLFSRMGVESQLDAMFSPTVTLRSGGYIVINQTEALVSIDVNSGRSTREHHIEDTALKTNLEAAEEVARQLRLRDLAGLIVIDFIDMDEKRNNRAVERKMSDCLRQDRARIQVGRISHFGLLEMSRQRIRASVLESSTEPCPHCGGSGHVRSVSSVALQLLRGLEETLMKGPTHNLTVRTRTDVALYVLNHKRGHLRDLENSFKVTLAVIADPTISGQQSFVIDRGEAVHTLEAAKAILAAQVAAFPAAVEDTYEYVEDETFEAEAEFEGDDEEAAETTPAEGAPVAEGEEGPRRKRRRRRRGRGGEAREGAQASDRGDASGIAPLDDAVGEASDSDEGDDESEEQNGEVRAEQEPNGERRPRRRGRRGGRRRRGGNEPGGAEGDQPREGIVSSIADDLGPLPESEVSEAAADLSYPSEPAREERPMVPSPQPVSHPVSTSEDGPAEAPRKRSTVREKVSFFFGDSSKQESAPAPVQTPASSEPAASPEPEAAPEPAPRRAGWWSRRGE
ncbi:ribonuclease E/G [Bradyrhizobium sp. G127]|uniref:Rne/Rng family ribonuclease n=1 Tax=Bradyrhizobium sp. G127 TaxID=2904800 RepID=UPI001F25930A|nr:ribonuclease E/G [Bradyrhizobium sp. G127]MCF2523466.1 Rne/Rng family ribonuclease [Bradyrhizobium sp. G127]